MRWCSKCSKAHAGAARDSSGAKSVLAEARAAVAANKAVRAGAAAGPWPAAWDDDAFMADVMAALPALAEAPIPAGQDEFVDHMMGLGEDALLCAEISAVIARAELNSEVHRIMREKGRNRARPRTFALRAATRS